MKPNKSILLSNIIHYIRDIYFECDCTLVEKVCTCLSFPFYTLHYLYIILYVLVLFL